VENESIAAISNRPIPCLWGNDDDNEDLLFVRLSRRLELRGAAVVLTSEDLATMPESIDGYTLAHVVIKRVFSYRSAWVFTPPRPHAFALRDHS